MSASEKGMWIEKVRRIGPWTGVRHMRNEGVPFEVAHEIMLGRKPRYR